jgi:GR25 family glycosyltransferase involved in LPS biosynthesis
MIIILTIIIYIIYYIINNLLKINENFKNYNNLIDCYVITLGNKDRLNNIKIQQKKCNFKIKIFKAYNGNDLNNYTIKDKLIKDKILSPNFNGNKNDKIKNREIGCYMSHLNLYKYINNIKYNKYKYTLILEDDVSINNNFMKNLNNGLNILNDITFDILYLGYHDNNDKNGIQIKDNIYKYIKGNITGTHAYLINNESIYKLIEVTKYVTKAIDWKLTEAIKNNKLNMYYFYPNICNIINMSSTIHG